MRVGKIIRRQAVRRGQSVQVGHYRIANYLPETVIFQHYQENMVCRCGRRRWIGCYVERDAAASGAKQCCR